MAWQAPVWQLADILVWDVGLKVRLGLFVQFVKYKAK